MHSLENSLIDIMRAENDSLKGKFRKRLFPAVNNWEDLLTQNKKLQFGVGKVQGRPPLFFYFQLSLHEAIATHEHLSVVCLYAKQWETTIS